jgi:hypothetical protein
MIKARTSSLIVGQSMSVVGQSRRFGRRLATSGFPPETDILRAGRHVSNVPTADT